MVLTNVKNCMHIKTVSVCAILSVERHIQIICVYVDSQFNHPIN